MHERLFFLTGIDEEESGRQQEQRQYPENSCFAHNLNDLGQQCANIVIFGNKNTKLRKNEWLNDVYLSFSTLVEKDAINVDTIGSVLLPKKVKYLLHWNSEDKTGGKHIYELSELHTYGYEKGFYDYVQSLLFTENKKDSDGAVLLAQFKDAVESSNSLTEVIYKVGILNYRSWRWVIIDLWKEELTSRACGDL